MNRFMKEIDSAQEEAEAEAEAEVIQHFPLQNTLTRPLRKAAAERGHAEFLSLWAGQGVRMARRQSAAELMARLVREIDQTIAMIEKRASAGVEARKPASH